MVDDFSRERVPIDAREFHVYAVERTPRAVTFSVAEPPADVDEPSWPHRRRSSSTTSAGYRLIA